MILPLFAPDTPVVGVSGCNNRPYDEKCPVVYLDYSDQ
ncbi:hypothetical protein Closa_1833 [[Clostridium] saccharolyticum WM1]|uniref:Uncharacterized protein n=1 Tax=Lacrimispora saccharolytica (strain ATCC 35040 / DSM 2544 / NRCC 2533 / WM1) TaxID=610130 RepID=D9QZW5_LACSW|nr:hypothetical protein Closa_1833 [[Clostridium] saccharolyticum WM1]